MKLFLGVTRRVLPGTARPVYQALTLAALLTVAPAAIQAQTPAARSVKSPPAKTAPARSLRETGSGAESGSLSGDAVAYNGKPRQATVSGSVPLKRKNKPITADKAVYSARDEKVVFTGNVTLVNDSGDKMTAPTAT